VQAIRVDTHVFHEVAKQNEFSTGVVITFQVMAFAGMSPGHPHGVGALAQCGQGKLRAHATGAGDPDDPDVGWILHPADTGQVGGTVAAPVAQKGLRFSVPILT
jgi:hypothetical protein